MTLSTNKQTNKYTNTKEHPRIHIKKNIQQKNMQNESIIEISIQTIHDINNLRCKDVKFKYEIDRFKKNTIIQTHIDLFSQWNEMNFMNKMKIEKQNRERDRDTEKMSSLSAIKRSF